MNKVIVFQIYMWYNDEFKILNLLMLLNSYLFLNWREFKKKWINLSFINYKKFIKFCYLFQLDIYKYIILLMYFILNIVIFY